jgi:hypothetical protein
MLLIRLSAKTTFFHSVAPPFDLGTTCSIEHSSGCAELHDLWAIDNEAYREASITYAKFEDWWRSYSHGLRAIFFRTRVMAAIGIWPLSCSCAGLLKAPGSKSPKSPAAKCAC